MAADPPEQTTHLGWYEKRGENARSHYKDRWFGRAEIRGEPRARAPIDAFMQWLT